MGERHRVEKVERKLSRLEGEKVRNAAKGREGVEKKREKKRDAEGEVNAEDVRSLGERKGGNGRYTGE